GQEWARARRQGGLRPLRRPLRDGWAGLAVRAGSVAVEDVPVRSLGGSGSGFGGVFLLRGLGGYGDRAGSSASLALLHAAAGTRGTAPRGVRGDGHPGTPDEALPPGGPAPGGLGTFPGLLAGGRRPLRLPVSERPHAPGGDPLRRPVPALRSLARQGRRPGGDGRARGEPRLPRGPLGLGRLRGRASGAGGAVVGIREGGL
ncbi:MAG: hypothetical protein AVDCRST_MAG25-1203, partial [uncultured Rubrobacteraceae bacterium]